MKYICPECGSDIPEESDFCYHCGRKRDNTIRLDQSGHFIPPVTERCRSCGAEIPVDAWTCPKCNEPRTRKQLSEFKPKMVKNGWIGIVLAAIGGILVFIPVGPIGPLPGLFSIFGLGHIYFKKWKRAGWFLILSVFMLFIRVYQTGVDSFFSHVLFILITGFIFMMQIMEVFVLSYMPPKTAE
ncbi:MAG: zinc ribbon domain-containing protein [Methanomassiliicoccaceae archaeon]|nr:zinc ribbon domain-containing protein [Methanomassiliicoccaceae archaeon]